MSDTVWLRDSSESRTILVPGFSTITDHTTMPMIDAEAKLTAPSMHFANLSSFLYGIAPIVFAIPIEPSCNIVSTARNGTNSLQFSFISFGPLLPCV